MNYGIKRRVNHKGFTLLELLIAVAILAIIVVPILSAFLISVQTNAKAKDKQNASIAASNVVEDIKGRDMERIIADMTLKEDGTYEKIEIVNGQAYTVITTIDDTQYTNAPSELDDESTDYNEEELCKLYSVDKAYDGIYVQSKDQDVSFAKKLKKGMLSRDEWLEGFRRDTVISIVKENGENKVYVQSTYSYGKGDARVEESTAKQAIFSGKDNSPRNIYVFYQPMYNGSLRTVNEIFTIEQMELMPVNIYLVCQNPEDEDAKNYVTQVRCVEKIRTDWKNHTITHIRSNLPEGQLGTHGLWLTYRMENTPNDITDAQWNGSGKYENVAAASILDFKDLTNQDDNAWVYKVSVSAYKGQGDTREDESLVTYETTITKE
ncbi:MAG: type II secretion system protein [Lachnospiraceae bacterium]|nr:type II secretion system protein [Lachnospiraceae bacterium]